MIIVKIGGGAGINLKGIVTDLAELNEKFIIVHGANALR
ncbi:MAG: acetylglutamate kinase, partial [Calditrichaceae bacterium]